MIDIQDYCTARPQLNPLRFWRAEVRFEMSALGAMLQPELAGPGVDALSLSMPASGAEPLAEFGRKRSLSGTAFRSVLARSGVYPNVGAPDNRRKCSISSASVMDAGLQTVLCIAIQILLEPHRAKVD